MLEDWNYGENRKRECNGEDKSEKRRRLLETGDKDIV